MVTFEYPYSECIDPAQIYKKVTSVRSSGVLLFLLAFFNNFSWAIFSVVISIGHLCVYSTVRGNGVASQGICWKEGVHVFLCSHPGKEASCSWEIEGPWVFVEKCLAAASIRLPARELLMDPFLQCEGDHEAIECGPSLLIAKCQTDDMGLVWFLKTHQCLIQQISTVNRAVWESIVTIKQMLLARKKGHLHFQSAKSLKHRMIFNPLRPHFNTDFTPGRSGHARVARIFEWRVQEETTTFSWDFTLLIMSLYWNL